MNEKNFGFSLPLDNPLAIIIIVGLTFIEGCNWAPFALRPDAVFTPHGEMSLIARAASPNLKYIAKKNIGDSDVFYGIYERWSGDLVSEFYDCNKGFAWSADSKLLAAMSHGGGGGIRIFDIKTGEVLTHLDIDGMYHYMAFKRGSNRTLIVAYSPDGSPSGLKTIKFELEGD